MGSRRLGLTAAITVGPIAAWRFAQAYKARAGYPHRHAPAHDPSALGLPFEEVRVPSAGMELPGWWIPARTDAGRAASGPASGAASAAPVSGAASAAPVSGAASAAPVSGAATPGPAVLLVHGWESARDRTLPNVQILHALGIHVLTIDVRGHGLNPAEELPLTAGEFGEDALAGVRWLLARDDVTKVGVLGHSMGGIGALLAAAAEPGVAAVVAASTPADPYRLTRQTFRLARLPFPGPLAWPLAWLTTHVFLQPRGHTVRDVSAARAVERYEGPVLLIHGDADRVVPISHLRRLEAAARRARDDAPDPPDVEVLVISGGEHSWLYEFPVYRGAVGRFLATHLGPLDPPEAEAIARAVPAARLPQREHPFSAIEPEKSGLATLVQAIKAAGNNRRDGTTPAPEAKSS